MARKVVIPIPDNNNNNNNYMTLVIVIFVLLTFVYYLWSQVNSLEKQKQQQYLQPQSVYEIQPARQDDVRLDVGRCNKGDSFSNPYIPPIRCDSGSLMAAPLRMSVPDNAIPINIPTQHYNTSYSQVGIITKQMAHRNEILPLMGRRTVTARDKWQYYTISGGHGNLQAKLPVKVSGRNCSGEYGCPEISTGDEIFVEGFQENFRATIYENGLFSYLPT